MEREEEEEENTEIKIPTKQTCVDATVMADHSVLKSSYK